MNKSNKDNQSASILFSNKAEDINLIRYSIDSLNHPFLITDLKFTIKYVNKAFIKTYGYPQDEIIGQPLDLIHSKSNDPEKILRINHDLKKKDWQGTLYHKRKNDKVFLVLANTSHIRNETDKTIAYVTTCIDLSDRSLVENIFELGEDKYKSLFSELKETIYESTPDGQIIDINPSGLELLGYDSIEELIAIDDASRLYKDPKDRKYLIERLEEEGFIKNYEIELVNKNGETLTLLETAICVKNSEGKTTCFRGILHDITESKRNQELLTDYLEQLATMNDQLKESEAELRRVNNEKDKFFSILSHDLKTPVSAIMSYSEILKAEYDSLSSDEIIEFVSSLNEVSQNLHELLEEILNWSRLQSGRISYCPEFIDLSALVDGLIKIYSPTAYKKNINMVSVVEGESIAFADENMISTVLRNLVSNAIKFSILYSTIKIEIKELADLVQISVIDNGIGIKKADIDKLFRIDIHHTTTGTANEMGTGLGLILCKELVEKNHGDINVDSEEGEGARFYFTLPKEPLK